MEENPSADAVRAGRSRCQQCTVSDALRGKAGRASCL